MLCSICVRKCVIVCNMTMSMLFLLFLLLLWVGGRGCQCCFKKTTLELANWIHIRTKAILTIKNGTKGNRIRICCFSLLITCPVLLLLLFFYSYCYWCSLDIRIKIKCIFKYKRFCWSKTNAPNSLCFILFLDDSVVIQPFSLPPSLFSPPLNRHMSIY